MRKLHLLIITIICLVLGWQLLQKGYYPMHDDLQVMRLYEMRRCFNDGQIPCRWAPDMDNNYGQAMFNYYTVMQEFGKPVRRFVLYECKKRKNKDGSSQMRKYVIDFQNYEGEFELFRRLLTDASQEISRQRIFLPNPSDMFEGENSFDIYRLGLGQNPD